MDRIKTALNALVGYAGSSENPQKMSLRFMGILTGLISQFSPLLSLVVAHFSVLPAGVTVEQFSASLSGVIEPMILTGACLMWIIGAVRAVMATPTVAGFLKR